MSLIAAADSEEYIGLSNEAVQELTSLGITVTGKTSEATLEGTYIQNAECSKILGLNIPFCTYGKFMLWKMQYFTSQSMDYTNHKFPVYATQNVQTHLKSTVERA